MDDFFTTNFLLWLQVNLEHGGEEQGTWSLTFRVAIDVLWRARNDLVFNQQTRHSHVLVCIVKNTVAGVLKAREMVNRTTITSRAVQYLEPIHWKPPPDGFVKLNCDGSRSTEGACSACGGILRDHTGGFCFAFSCNLGNCPALMAEL